MAAREKEIHSDIEDAIAKYNEASARLAEAKKAQAQAMQVVQEINANVAKDIAEFQNTIRSSAEASMAQMERSAQASLKDMEKSAAERLESYISQEAVERGLIELQTLNQAQKSKFMDAAIASL
ncbi:atpF [Symbiodinium pilosum]|uniref:AtpF protein n=1 Tax=Symbiodinium pilosum TaxID=2952 RepID=A0A812XZ89_SYMPI|nr:atpF [Symbiodinium pilosum]